MGKSLTVVMTAYNEEETVAHAVAATNKALAQYVNDYEIIIIDDGSTDRTGEISDALAKENPRIKAVHNKPNKNIGYAMQLGAQIATKEYCLTFISADNYPDEESFKNLLSSFGEKDVTLAYLKGYGDRHWTRRLVSFLYVAGINLLFGLRIRYYNGPTIAKTKERRTIPSMTDGVAQLAVVTTTLLRRGLSYKEVPITLSPERKGLNVQTLKRNLPDVIKTLALLFWKLNIKKEFYASENPKN